MIEITNLSACLIAGACTPRILRRLHLTAGAAVTPRLTSPPSQTPHEALAPGAAAAAPATI